MRGLSAGAVSRESERNNDVLSHALERECEAGWLRPRRLGASARRRRRSRRLGAGAALRARRCVRSGLGKGGCLGQPAVLRCCGQGDTWLSLTQLKSECRTNRSAASAVEFPSSAAEFDNCCIDRPREANGVERAAVVVVSTSTGGIVNTPMPGKPSTPGGTGSPSVLPFPFPFPFAFPSLPLP